MAIALILGKLALKLDLALFANRIAFVTVSRFFPRTTLKRHSQLVVVVLPDEASAFQTYRLLQYHGISPEHLAIVGQGYSSPERVGLLKPMQIAFQKAYSLALVAGILGFVLGLVIVLVLHLPSQITLDLNTSLIVPAASLLGAFLGAVLGGLFGFFGEGNTAGIYRHHLSQGRYLLMMEGPEKLVRWGQQVIHQYCLPKV